MRAWTVHLLRREDEHRVPDILDRGGEISPMTNHHGHYRAAQAVVPEKEPPHE